MPTAKATPLPAAVLVRDTEDSDTSSGPYYVQTQSFICIHLFGYCFVVTTEDASPPSNAEHNTAAPYLWPLEDMRDAPAAVKVVNTLAT